MLRSNWRDTRTDAPPGEARRWRVAEAGGLGPCPCEMGISEDHAGMCPHGDGQGQWTVVRPAHHSENKPGLGHEVEHPTGAFVAVDACVERRGDRLTVHGAVGPTNS